MTTALRPMRTSEVLDRTFHLYRNHFLLFVGIGILPPALALAMKLAAVAVGWFAGTRSSIVGSAGAAAAGFSFLAGFLGFLLVYMVGYALASGATVHAVSLVHLDRPANIRESYRKVRSNLGRVLNVIFSVAIRSMGVMVLSVLVFAAAAASATRASAALGAIGAIIGFILMVVGVYFAVSLYARYSLAVPACLLENIPARQALRRSSLLTKGERGRIWLIFFLTAILSMVLTYLLVSPALILAALNKGKATVSVEVLSYLGEFLAGCLAGPIATIAIALVYYDERVKKEAFDLQYMMEAIDGSTAQAAVAGSAG